MTAALLTAFAGGVLTLTAPCAAMLVPAFFAYAFNSRTTLFARSFVFFTGLLVALVPLGAFAGVIGGAILPHQQVISIVAGVAVALMGVVQALALPFPHVRLPGRKSAGRSDTPIAVFLLGLGYGLAAIGCTGPILGAIFVLATQTASTMGGIVLMLAYATGMFLPVLVLALLWEACNLSSRAWLKPRPVQLLGRRTTVGALVSGVLFVILGLLMATTGGLGPASVFDAARQQEVESTVMAALRNLPPVAGIALVVAGVAALALAIVWISGRRRDR